MSAPTKKMLKLHEKLKTMLDFEKDPREKNWDIVIKMASTENANCRPIEKYKSSSSISKGIRSKNLQLSSVDSTKKTTMSIKKKSEDSVPRDTSASNEININRSISLNRNQNKRSASREQESRNFSARSSSGQSRTGFDRKSMRSVPSGSSSVCSRSTMSNNRDLSKRSFKCEYLEATEAVPILIIAAQKQKEVIQMLQYEKMEFQRKLADGDDKSDSIISDESLGQSSLENVNFSLGDKQSCKFDESYNNYLDEIMHVWINLFYFILNIRINLIKLVNRSGKECFVPNMKVEKDILTRATESIRFFSALKMKSLTEALDQLRQKNESKKSDIELIEKEEVISSSFISEMEYLGNKTRDIVSRLKKIHERDSKI